MFNNKNGVNNVIYFKGLNNSSLKKCPFSESFEELIQSLWYIVFIKKSTKKTSKILLSFNKKINF